MNTDSKKEKQDKKIVPFEIQDEILADQEIDRMVKESLIQEADKLEAELNADPNLTGVGASEDLLQSIIGKLKDQGIWGEEPKEKEDGEEINSAIQKDEKTETDRNISEINSVSESGEPVQNIEDLYALLPEEDRRALELGKKMEQEQRRREAGRLKKRKALRYGGTAAAMLAAVFGLSMTSEANRRLVKRAWDVMAMNFNFHVQTDYTGDEEQVRSKSKEEVAAMEEISGNLGVAALSLEVLPRGMEYDDYDIIADGVEAVMFYVYQDNIFSVTFINVDVEGSTYYMLDQRTELIEKMNTEQEFEAQIWETNQGFDEEDRAYIAEIEHEGCRYILNGILSLEEMEEIVESAFIL